MSGHFKTIEHQTDFCVVGGGLSGLCAAVAAARHGAKTVLIQERPMLGGNCSSEIRMWVCGAQGRDLLETGIIEELMMENYYRNPDKNYSVWDNVLYEAAARQENLELILNCSVNGCEMSGNRIVSVTGWQMTTQTYQKVSAALFADCSGDSVLAPLSGARFRVGRESELESGESIGRAVKPGDRNTMGMSCMLQAREEDRPVTFIPPKSAYHFTADDLPHRIPDLSQALENFWYLELGGDGDSIGDTEQLRDELIRTAYGLWDFVKNDPSQREKNARWRLDWVGILPGKRESRRYVGAYTLDQNDLQSAGHFPDVAAYGGWPMDDHDPGGFKQTGHPNVNYPVAAPYGIPLRCLYSADIDNLMFAGRNISVTHWALSSTRVMGTCALLGQAVGTAAGIAAREGCMPDEVYRKHLDEFKNTLMDDDCYLPGERRAVPEVTLRAEITGCEGAANLINGIDRPVNGADNGVYVSPGDAVELRFGAAAKLHRARIVWDSDLNRKTMPVIGREPFGKNMMCNKFADMPDFRVPAVMTKTYRLEGRTAGGETVTIFECDNNYQRLNVIPVSGCYESVRLIPLSTWGADKAHIFAFEVC